MMTLSQAKNSDQDAEGTEKGPRGVNFSSMLPYHDVQGWHGQGGNKELLVVTQDDLDPDKSTHHLYFVIPYHDERESTLKDEGSPAEAEVRENPPDSFVKRIKKFWKRPAARGNRSGKSTPAENDNSGSNVSAEFRKSRRKMSVNLNCSGGKLPADIYVSGGRMPADHDASEVAMATTMAKIGRETPANLDIDRDKMLLELCGKRIAAVNKKRRSRKHTKMCSKPKLSDLDKSERQMYSNIDTRRGKRNVVPGNKHIRDEIVELKSELNSSVRVILKGSKPKCEHDDLSAGVRAENNAKNSEQKTINQEQGHYALRPTLVERDRGPKIPKQKTVSFESKQAPRLTGRATHDHLPNHLLRNTSGMIDTEPDSTVKKESNVSNKIRKRPDSPAHFAEADPRDNPLSKTKHGTKIGLKQQKSPTVFIRPEEFRSESQRELQLISKRYEFNLPAKRMNRQVATPRKYIRCKQTNSIEDTKNPCSH